jgi:NADH-quinone oxidoreductase E subunit
VSHGPSAPSHGHSGAHAHAEKEPYAPVFTAGSARRKELDDLMTRYPDKRATLLPALWMVQQERGWISEDAMREVGDVLGCTAAYVKGVVTFYTMYHQHPVGKHFIQVCTTSPCLCAGADKVVEAFLSHTGCKELGLTSPDGKYTVIEVECLGACGFATPVQINEEYVENVTAERVPQILAELK